MSSSVELIWPHVGNPLYYLGRVSALLPQRVSKRGIERETCLSNPNSISTFTIPSQPPPDPPPTPFPDLPPEHEPLYPHPARAPTPLTHDRRHVTATEDIVPTLQNIVAAELGSPIRLEHLRTARGKMRNIVPRFAVWFLPCTNHSHSSLTSAVFCRCHHGGPRSRNDYPNFRIGKAA